ncbi:MAG TPA: hypothetical protein VFM39_00200 [bacterium]|nr:hypothetical protein [bacterium]
MPSVNGGVRPVPADFTGMIRNPAVPVTHEPGRCGKEEMPYMRIGIVSRNVHRYPGGNVTDAGD